jgi:hypothetical protein
MVVLDSPLTSRLLEDLTVLWEEYFMLWRLKLTFPLKKVMLETTASGMV